MAATLRLPFTRAESWLDTLRALRAYGHRIVALTPRPDATPLDACHADPARRVVLLVGSEGYGLSSDSMTAADVTVRIPIDPRADSLNVVVAAAIAMQRFGLDDHHVDAG
jgi:tRNA G18 (ribose-2'-O)-methylase SpoU